ncbi:MAG: PadR family transcriptional regulator [Cyclobacteriaceae bacterium]
MGKYTLGELEELVLIVVAILQTEAYGVNVMEELASQTRRKVNISAIHTTLDRLENKGLLSSTLGGATATRGGRRKRIFTMTASGRKILDETREMRNRLYNQIPDMI